MWTGILNILVSKNLIIGFRLVEYDKYSFLYGETQFIDLRDNESADEFIKRLLKRYPQFKKLFDGKEQQNTTYMVHSETGNDN